MEDAQRTLKSITESLGDFFRHLVPGVLVLIFVILTNHGWTTEALRRLRENTIGTNTLVIMAVAATAVGNVWFVAHRYIVHQLVDYLFWLCLLEGTPRRASKKAPDKRTCAEGIQSASTAHAADVASHTAEYLRACDNALTDLRHHVRLRSSGVVLMYMTAEILVIATCFADDGSFLAKHGTVTWLTAALLFLGALYQNYVVRLLEAQVISRPNGHREGA